MFPPIDFGFLMHAAAEFQRGFESSFRICLAVLVAIFIGDSLPAIAFDG
jgi:hypothetical protein